jgi:hypothetical protein
VEIKLVQRGSEVWSAAIRGIGKGPGRWHRFGSVPPAFFLPVFCLLLRFLGWFFGGVGLHGGPWFGRGDDHGFRVPEVHSNLGDFVGGIA